MRIIVSSVGKRWLWVSVGLFLMFASVAYVRFNAQPNLFAENYLAGKMQTANNEDLENEVEEVRPQFPGGYEPNADSKRLLNDVEKKSREKCGTFKGNPVKPDFDISEMSSSLTLADLNWDGDVGVWDGDFEQKFQEKQKQQNGTALKDRLPLKVFIVPFSHSDPGWLMTVDEYFRTYTNNTLSLMLKNLQDNSDMTFVWAETSFFKIWWDDLSESQRSAVRSLIRQGRLEILNGGFVMPDEATCHYYAIIHQYIYGHQWLLQNVQTTPKHGFSIDPFGYSSTMPYILKNLGFESMYIQRTHYVIRKKLMQSQASQFKWLQNWDLDNSDSMFCYMSHATLYDIKHTCGVETNICSQYDYQYVLEKLDSSTKIMAPAEQLLTQFKKTASMYPHDVMLFPIGMDFRWNNQYEWDSKSSHFRAIMTYLNKKYTGQVHIQFGTYKDYYDEVFKRMGTPDNWKNLPGIVGDFFPYADKTVEYWTGYFTSHPFQKALSRDLENHLRVAEMLFVIAQMKSYKLDSANLLQSFESAAKSLGLFQHHDAITGTSKLAVMNDYEKRLFFAIEDMYAVIQHIVTSMFWPDNIQHESLMIYDRRSGYSSNFPSQEIISLTVSGKLVPQRIVIFNPLASSRVSFVDLLVNTKHITIEDTNGKFVDYQTSSCFDSRTTDAEILPDCSRVTFLVDFTSVQFHELIIRPSNFEKAKQSGQKSSKMRDNGSKDWRVDIPVMIENTKLTAEFSPTTGLLERLSANGKQRSVKLEWKRYETSRSGAYLFWPNGIADLEPYPHEIRVIEGPLYSEIRVKISSNKPAVLTHVVRIFNSKSDLDLCVHIENTHNLASLSNAELVLRFSTDLKNNFTFFTDSNSFQMVRRQASHSLPMQANYYPATSMAFLQDQHSRFTIHLSQALGVGSQDIGQLEVMLDRILGQDDMRGVEEALMDTRIVQTKFRIQLETDGYCRDCKNNDPTAQSNTANLNLNNPVMTLTGAFVANEHRSNMAIIPGKSLLHPLPCDTHLLMIKPVKFEVNSSIGMIVHKLGTDCANSKGHQRSCQEKDEMSVLEFTGRKKLSNYNVTTLNFVENVETRKGEDVLLLKRKKLVAIKFDM